MANDDKTEEPKMPSGLDRDQQAEWRRIVSELRKVGTLAQTDRAMLENYVHAWKNVRVSRAQIKKGGYLIPAGNDTEKKNPAVDMEIKWANLVFSHLKDFGLTPAARRRMRHEKPMDDGFGDGEN